MAVKKQDPLSVDGLEQSLRDAERGMRGSVVPGSGLWDGMRNASVSVSAQKELARRITVAEGRIRTGE